MQPIFRSKPVKQSDMNAMAEAAARAAAGVGSTAIGSLNIGGANLPTPDMVRGWWIMITGQAGDGFGSGSASGEESGTGSGSGSGGSCNANYPWVMVVRRGCQIIQLSNERFGTTTQYPALEVNGNQQVPPGTIVFAWVNEDSSLPSLLFDYPFAGSGGSGSGNRLRVLLCASLVQITSSGTGTGTGTGTGIGPPP